MIKIDYLKNNTRYNPFEFEEKIYNYWVPYFKAKKGKKFFIILIAPPNITGSLHMGHTLENIILDIIARYKRLKGFNIVWFPGTDHAGIATQYVVEKELKKEGLNRFILGKEKFLERVWQWVDKYGNVILDQFKKLGLSLDWSRKKFTLDKKYVWWVEEAFIRYYKAGLIYRALRPVNWCPRCFTSLSDLEIEYKERVDKLYYIKYPLKDGGYLTIATTRPETMLGDTGVAVNPKDERYQDLIGKKVILPLINRELIVVSDLRVDPKFGTGILKVTPAHSLIDYEIGLRHDLEIVSVIDEYGKMNENAGSFKGLDYLQAREKIINELEKLNLIEKIEKINHLVPFCSRCDTELQIIPSYEWFLKMDKLAKLAIEAVKKNEVEIIPLRFKKPYFDWLKNIRDWCISRKLWWGQTIPVWFCKNCGEKSYVVDRRKPKKKCKICKKNNWQKTEEVFDTWFSSALWPFAILSTEQEKKYYPADLVSSARDILHLWITRMIFSGKYFMKKSPFKKVFIHPTVLTKEGKRMSKSLGTGIDPLDLIQKYGTDALRFGIIWQLSAHQDLRFDQVPLEQGQKFLNKIWNAYRFYVLTKEKFANQKNKKISQADRKIIKSLENTKNFVEKSIEKFELGLALKRIYKFFWNEVCDFYLESWKGETKNNLQVLDKVMIDSLKLLHPFLPHITQLIYFALGNKKPLFFEKI
ncbi:MAG: valine--tRNA ligase [Patescibacteria group bacterium]